MLQEDHVAPLAFRDREGVWNYEIPSDAVLKTKSVAPLRGLHSTTSRFADGTVLDFAPVGPIAPYRDGSIKLRPLYEDSHKRLYFIVGTERDLAAAVSHPSSLRLGGIQEQN